MDHVMTDAGPSPASQVARLARRAVLAVLALALLPVGLTLLYRFVDPPSTLILWRHLTGARVEQVWTPLERLPAHAPLTVIVAEDARFCRHDGIDWQEVAEAWDERDDGGPVRGGSSITQQVAKNLFLWPGRSWLRKGIEAPMALWIDLVLPKRRILEIYLNIAEWGPDGEFGIAAGTRAAFGKPVERLDRREAALLAAILPNPVRRAAAAPSPRVQKLATIYQDRARRWQTLDDCLPLPKPAR
jgi:monofunctional biosynthetic peptidoglycan transglycosylase